MKWILTFFISFHAAALPVYDGSYSSLFKDHENPKIVHFVPNEARLKISEDEKLMFGLAYWVQEEGEPFDGEMTATYEISSSEQNQLDWIKKQGKELREMKITSFEIKAEEWYFHSVESSPQIKFGNEFVITANTFHSDQLVELLLRDDSVLLFHAEVEVEAITPLIEGHISWSEPWLKKHFSQFVGHPLTLKELRFHLRESVLNQWALTENGDFYKGDGVEDDLVINKYFLLKNGKYVLNPNLNYENPDQQFHWFKGRFPITVRREILFRQDIRAEKQLFNHIKPKKKRRIFPWR